MIGIIGKKLGMSQIFEESGILHPVTVVEAGPCQVLQVKTDDKEGYSALQVGFSEKPERLVNKPEKGHFEKAQSKAFRFVKEFRNFDADYCKVGESITVEAFRVGDTVKVTGTTKGKGFQGVVKRYNFGGGPKTHGQSDRFRSPGSIGASAYPSHVIKGLRMPGRMGGIRKTVQGLKIVKIDPEHNLLYIRGNLPGANNSIVTIRRQER